MNTIYTIGFTKRKAKDFFEILIENNINKVFDIRLNNRSQLAGFSKGEDLKYFLKKIADIEYEHLPKAAPTDIILKSYHKKEISWLQYEDEFKKLMEERNLIEFFININLDRICFLCSEYEPKFCHRRLLVEYLQKNLPGIKIIHL